MNDGGSSDPCEVGLRFSNAHARKLSKETEVCPCKRECAVHALREHFRCSVIRLRLVLQNSVSAQNEVNVTFGNSKAYLIGECRPRNNSPWYIHSYSTRSRRFSVADNMEPISHLVKVSVPNYLAGLPIPNSIGGWFRLGGITRAIIK